MWLEEYFRIRAVTAGDRLFLLNQERRTNTNVNYQAGSVLFRGSVHSKMQMGASLLKSK